MNYKKMYEEESLSTKTVVAFTSALLVLQSWLWSGGALELIGDWTVNIPIAVYITIIAILFGLSVFFAVATVVPPHSPHGLSRVRSSSIRTARSLSRGLDIMILVGYTVSWLSAWTSIKQDPDSSQWLSDIVLCGGFGFFIYLGIWLTRRELSSMLREVLQVLPLIYRGLGSGLGVTARLARRLAGLRARRRPGIGNDESEH